MKIEPFEQYRDQYEAWFENHALAYDAELRAVRMLLPERATGLEIGIGTGRFAAALHICLGIEPAHAMRTLAQARGLDVIGGVAEALPFQDQRFDFVLMVTTLCFVDDVERAFREAWRVLKPGGCFVNGFVDRASFLGQLYQRYKDQNVFYKEARFYSVAEVLALLTTTRFQHTTCCQTVFHNLDEITDPEPVEPGYGEGAFVVVKAVKA
jgi:SAM-dependent methyltransferase